jgi:hypothetical protein
MQVQINADNSVENSAEFTGDVAADVESVFAWCEPQLIGTPSVDARIRLS